MPSSKRQGPDHQHFKSSAREWQAAVNRAGDSHQSAHQDAARAALACLPEEVENLKTSE
ncbi:MAG: hypothetical protein U0Y68_06740 [Blastocatellia bacterium]